MLSGEELPRFLQNSLSDAYTRMEKVQTDQDFKRLINTAPAFVFARTNDFIKATKSDSIVVLVPPNKHYEFEILSHDADRNRIIINSIDFKLITEEKFKELLMDYYPMIATL